MAEVNKYNAKIAGKLEEVADISDTYTVLRDGDHLLLSYRRA